MDSISKLAQSLALTRRQASPKAPTTPVSGEKSAAPAQAPKGRRGPDAGTSLRERVVSGLAALSEADMASHDRQVTVFVEQILLHEWGASFRESTQFRQTVKRVARAMKNEPLVRAELDALLHELALESRQQGQDRKK